ncbi:MAG: type II toxin-antitoxin system RelE/ParE family toxin [Acetobacteraceae bacterium]|nr:type II toxin-antitoxin system RelE/ParE family toxin [Acetobacteraceae bacterium]
MAHRVVFAPEAQADLIELYDYLAERAGPERALAYTERIETTCRGLATFPERGSRRDDIRPGLRVIGVGRRVAIAYHIGAETVTIDRALYGGRDLGAALGGGSSR